jgi:hypothetical protein
MKFLNLLLYIIENYIKTEKFTGPNKVLLVLGCIPVMYQQSVHCPMVTLYCYIWKKNTTLLVLTMRTGPMAQDQ